MTTIKNVAEKSGVSIGTVDRVIHNRGHVSKETETRVRQAIEELDYKPNFFARQLKLSKIFRFGILMPRLSQDSNYWKMPARGIKKAGDELNKQRTEIEYFYYDRYSHMSFALACEQVLKAGLDGLLIAPVLSNIAEEFIDKIPDDLPYVFFDSYVPNSNCLSSIVQDSFLSGWISAKLMRILIKEEGSVAAIRVLPEDYHVDERIKGFQSFFSENSDIRLIVHNAIREKEKSDFHGLTKKIVAENKDLKGIFVSNALTYLVAEFLESNTPRSKIHIVGYDLIKENVNYLKKGYIDFLISQKPERQGYLGIYTLYRKVALNEDVPGKIMIPIDIIMKENLDHYLR